MTKKRFASVWDAIEDSASEAASIKLRAELANQISERMPFPEEAGGIRRALWGRLGRSLGKSRRA